MTPGLEKALHEGKLREKLLFLLENHWDFVSSAEHPQGNTLLHWICIHATPALVLEIIIKLIKTSTKPIQEIVNVKNNQGETPLDLIIFSGNTDTVSFLRHHGGIFGKLSDLFSKTFDDNKFLEILENLKAKKITMLTPVEADGKTLLHLVVKYGSLTVLHKALEQIQNSKVDCITHTGVTPLMIAIQRRSVLGIHALLEKGANPTLEDHSGKSAVMLAKDLKIDTSIRLRPIAEYIELQQTLTQAFHTFTIEECLKQLQAKNFSFDERFDINNNTILHSLVRNIPYLMLIISGILDKTDLNTQNTWGETPLILAAKQGRPEICALLIERNADPTIKDHKGKTYKDYLSEFSIPQPQQEKLSKTYFDYLYNAIMVANFTRLRTKQKKVELIFDVFKKCIQEQQLHYNGIKRDEGLYLLDCRIGKRYTVNCFDLAYALGYLLKYFEIDAKIHVYRNYQSISFKHGSSRLYGDLVCFDKEHHARIAATSDSYGFDQHCVISCLGTYYDPTFCCFYDKAEDILAPDTKVKIPFNPKNRFSFKWPFLATLSKIFSIAEWTHSYTKGKEDIHISHSSQQYKFHSFNLNGETLFETLNLPGETLGEIIHAWKETEKVKLATYSVMTRFPAIKNSLDNTLKDEDKTTTRPRMNI